MKNILKAFVFVILLAFLAGGVLLFAQLNNQNEPDIIKDILQNSELKNRRFSADVQEISTPSGLKFYLMMEDSSPLISVSFKFLHSGLAYESEKFGRVNFLADMLTQGTKNFTAEQYREFLQQNGIKVSFSADYDDLDGQFTFPRENLEKAIPILQETLYSPRFGEKEMDLLKSQYEVSFAAQNESESERFAKITRPILYGNHPYSRNTLGDANDIKNLTAADLVEFMNEYFVKDNLLISIAGAADEKTATEIAESLFSSFLNEAKNHDLPEYEYDFSFQKHEKNQNFAQNRVLLAAKGVYRRDKDFYPLYVANFIFGGSGLTSRLNEELRGKRGLTYGAYTGLSIRDKSALLRGSFTTSADNYEEALNLAIEKWREFGQNGVKKDEFLKAKDYMTDSFNLRFDSTAGIASMLTEIQKQNLGKDFLQKRNDYVRAITFEEVNAAAKKYFSDNFIVIGVGQIENE